LYRKYRKVKKPSIEDLNQMRDDFNREQQNMLLLRYPYLTIQQEIGHMIPKKMEKNYMEMFRKMKREKFSKEVTLADHLAHLRITEAWD